MCSSGRPGSRRCQRSQGEGGGGGGGLSLALLPPPGGLLPPGPCGPARQPAARRRPEQDRPVKAGLPRLPGSIALSRGRSTSRPTTPASDLQQHATERRAKDSGLGAEPRPADLKATLLPSSPFRIQRNSSPDIQRLLRESCTIVLPPRLIRAVSSVC